MILEIFIKAYTIIKLSVLFVLLAMIGNLSIYAQSVRLLTIDEMYHLAEKNNRQLKLSKTSIEMARRATAVARNGQLPSLNVGVSLSYISDGLSMERDFSNIEMSDRPNFENKFGFEASQIVFAGRAVTNSIVRAKLEEQIAELDYDKNRLDICFLLVGYYLDLYKLINQREVYLKNIEQTNLLINNIKSKKAQGMALSSDVTRHELLLQDLQLALIQIDNNCEILNHHLVITLGLPVETVIQPDTSILDLNLSNVSQAGLIEIANDNLPELRAASVNIEVAQQDIKIARADYFPKISLFAGDHLSGPILTTIPAINKNFNSWQAGVELNYSLSSIFKSNRIVKMAKTRQQLAVDTKNVIEENIELDIHRAYINYKESFEKMHTYEKSLELANENYRLIDNRYLNDLVLITEMLDASNVKLNAELEVVNAKINIIYQYYKLQRVLGKTR